MRLSRLSVRGMLDDLVLQPGQTLPDRTRYLLANLSDETQRWAVCMPRVRTAKTLAVIAAVGISKFAF